MEQKAPTIGTDAIASSAGRDRLPPTARGVSGGRGFWIGNADRLPRHRPWPTTPPAGRGQARVEHLGRASGNAAHTAGVRVY
jgi:hypothetical protein